MNAIYTAEATSVGGRSGKVQTPDGVLDFEIRPPQAMGGPEGKYTNPEQLFAAGYAACFGSALSHVALKNKMHIKPVVTTRVSISKKENDEGYQLSVEIEASLPGLDLSIAEQLVNEAHQMCPYSNATRNNIDVTLKVINGQVNVII